VETEIDVFSRALIDGINGDPFEYILHDRSGRTIDRQLNKKEGTMKRIFLAAAMAGILVAVNTFPSGGESLQKQNAQSIPQAQSSGKGGKAVTTMNPRGFKPEPFTGPDGRKGWKLRLPENRPLATPAYWNGMIFVGGGFGSYEFYALDAASGKVIWQFHTGDDGPTAAVVSDGYVAFNTESCILYVLEAKTGKEVWSKWLGDPLMSQPAVAGDKLFMAYPGSDGQHYLACFGLKDGRECWKVPIAGELVTAPVIDDNSAYVTTLEGTVYRFQSADGKQLWSDSKNATSAPMVYKGQVYLSRREAKQSGQKTEQYEGLAQVERDKGRQLNKELWVKQKAEYLAVDKNSKYAAAQKANDASVGFASAPASAKLHQAESNLGVSSVSGVWAYQGSRPMVSNGNSYQSMGDNLQCLDVKTGEKQWEQKRSRRDREGGGRLLTPPSLTSQKLFIGSSDGEILCYQQSDGKLLWTFDSKEPIRFQPSVAKGRVFFTTDNGTIYSLETGDEKDDGWYMWGGNAGHNGISQE
jgi:Ca-activated chloride channel homolog